MLCAWFSVDQGNIEIATRKGEEQSPYGTVSKLYPFSHFRKSFGDRLFEKYMPQIDGTEAIRWRENMTSLLELLEKAYDAILSDDDDVSRDEGRLHFLNVLVREKDVATVLDEVGQIHRTGTHTMYKNAFPAISDHFPQNDQAECCTSSTGKIMGNANNETTGGAEVLLDAAAGLLFQCRYLSDPEKSMMAKIPRICPSRSGDALRVQSQVSGLCDAGA